MSYPFEAKLRPAFELRAALVSTTAALVLLYCPARFLLTPSMAAALATLLLAHATWRTVQGIRILRYRAHLREALPYEMRADQIPFSAHKLFLGRGFRWDQRHAQRLYETRLPALRRYCEPGCLHRASRAVGLGGQGQGLTAWLKGKSPAGSNSSGGVAEAGGDPALHGVGTRESEIWTQLSERVGHTLVLGTTRVGKTRLAELMIAQDIARGEVVIVFDPKGDAGLLRHMYEAAGRAGRTEAFHLFHLGYPSLSARYNPIGDFSRVTEVASRIAGQLPAEGKSAAFREFVWRFVNVMARALVALGRTPGYEQLNRYAVNIEPLLIDYYEFWLDHHLQTPDWRAEVAALPIDKKTLNRGLQSRGAHAVALVEYANRRQLYDPIAHALASTLNYEKTYFDKLVASLLPLLEKLTAGDIASLISPDYSDRNDTRPVFDWMTVIQTGGIVYVGLDALSDPEVAAAVGNSMFADLTSVAGRLYKRATQHPDTPMRKISLHADEFNELIGDEFVPLLNKAGGAGFQVTAYTQTWSDIEARVGSRAKAGQIGGNFNTLIMMRVKDIETARLLTDQLPVINVFARLVSSSVSDTNDAADFADFASRTEDRVTSQTQPLVTPADVMSLPKGQAFALLDGGHLYKLRIPLTESADPPDAANLQEIADKAQQRRSNRPSQAVN